MAPVLPADSLVLNLTQLRLTKLHLILKSSKRPSHQPIPPLLEALIKSTQNLSNISEAFQILPLSDDRVVLSIGQINNAIDALYANITVQYPSLRMGVSPRWYRKMAVRRFEATDFEAEEFRLLLEERLKHIDAVNTYLIKDCEANDFLPTSEIKEG
ncbi:MAG: hypothetical protein M1814_002215 [Vezdaea aestivalis]|nr:MAG: hypothetical protein M1814_002215 [Vezdaea aestivalis]